MYYPPLPGAARDQDGPRKRRAGGRGKHGRLCYAERDALPNREAAHRASFAFPAPEWAFTHGAFPAPLCLRRCFIVLRGAIAEGADMCGYSH